MTERVERAINAILGAYVADAAALGFHWLYKPERIAKAAPVSAAFFEPDATLFDDVSFGFVHAGKPGGALSQYGAQMRVMVRSLAATGGRFDLADYQDRFAACFGPGGDWSGYIDRPTAATLVNLAAGRRDPSGADDDQLPAVSKLPPLVACADDAAFFETIDSAVAATNANATALAYARACAGALRAANEGAVLQSSLEAGIDAAPADAAAALHAAMDSEQNDPVAFAGEIGRHCHLPSAGPVIWHIAARAPDYRSAVELNIRAGGDNCGRAPVLGALFAAVHGVGGKGVPPDWLMRLRPGRALADEIAALAAAMEGN